MRRPVAFKVLPDGKNNLFRVSAEPLDVSTVAVTAMAPAVVVTRKAKMLAELATGIVDVEDIVAVTDGDWANAILIVTDTYPTEERNLIIEKQSNGDEAFFSSVQDDALLNLSRTIVKSIRSAGIKGQLIKMKNGRWVNSPINSFTLKVQPRKQNVQFTLYGNPYDYKHDGFLLEDRNGYSHGWVEDKNDVDIFEKLVSQAHARKINKIGRK